MIPRTVTCGYCGRIMANDPGSYYHEKACELKAADAKLEAARASGADPAEIRKLERERENVAYVGD